MTIRCFDFPAVGEGGEFKFVGNMRTLIEYFLARRWKPKLLWTLTYIEIIKILENPI